MSSFSDDYIGVQVSRYLLCTKCGYVQRFTDYSTQRMVATIKDVTPETAHPGTCDGCKSKIREAGRIRELLANY